MEEIEPKNIETDSKILGRKKMKSTIKKTQRSKSKPKPKSPKIFNI